MVSHSLSTRGMTGILAASNELRIHHILMAISSNGFCHNPNIVSIIPCLVPSMRWPPCFMPGPRLNSSRRRSSSLLCLQLSSHVCGLTRWVARIRSTNVWQHHTHNQQTVRSSDRHVDKGQPEAAAKHEGGLQSCTSQACGSRAVVKGQCVRAEKTNE